MEARDLSELKVLLVDDNELNLEIERESLEDEGITVITANDGKEALNLFLKSEPGDYDVILMDMMMPIMDGYQALKNIREIEKEHNIPEDKSAKIIMTTALNEEKNVKKAFELGCTVYCGKPIDVEQLKKILEKLGLI